MNPRTALDIRNQKIVFWIGTSFPVCYGIGWALLAGFFPPPAPSLSADDVAQFYRDNSVAIRLGMAVCVFVNCFCVPWSVALWAQMKRLEQGVMPVWSMFGLTIGLTNTVFFMTPTCVWMAIAFVADFRPDWPAAGLRVMNDTAWILWFTTYAPATLQCWCLAYLGLQDKREKPLFPRWWCYMQYWVGLAFFPAGFIAFFTAGPFSWVGIIGLWVPVVIYFFYFPLTAWGIYKAIDNTDEYSADSRLIPAMQTTPPAAARVGVHA